jgi:threonine/homoserine/homoserine lactone efflux protein
MSGSTALLIASVVLFCVGHWIGGAVLLFLALL